ncbi:LamG-like jellyroll fold domain-containing protein [Cerasicoccus frondis]|uniref:LamG-like jellyroll fold domain-containing protein n=1 Tax=Cerasicoccus frondis TaxID=490090 RepID=UPI0028525E52|nr:LamG-like jellyroll fold domain-containing protein [Cerasicoccus frondis]
MSSAVVPIHYFPFDNNTNDIVGGVTGTVNGNVTQTTGFTGNAYSFDAASWITALIDINSSVLPSMTMGAWVQTNLASGARQVISHDNGAFDRSLGLDPRGSGPAYGWATFNGTGVLGKTDATLNNWTFVAVSYDMSSNSTLLYTYDYSVGTVQTLSSGYFSDSGMTYIAIGTNPGLTGEAFSGIIDNVFIYDQALTETELDDVRINGVQGVPEPSTYVLMALGGGLVFYWMRRRARG